MTNKISNILIHKIKESLPKILVNINENLTIVKNDLIELGDTLPITDEGKISLVHNLITNFNKQFISTIEDRGVILDTGRNIKNIFISYRNFIEKNNPFSDDNITKNYNFIKKIYRK